MSNELKLLDLNQEEIQKLRTKTNDAKNTLLARASVMLIFSLVVFIMPMSWLPTKSFGSGKMRNMYQLFGLTETIVLTIIMTGLFLFISLKDLKYMELLKDKKEKKKVIVSSIVARSGTYKDENYIKFKHGKPKFIRSHKRSLLRYKRNDPIQFEAYKNSGILIQIV